MHKILYVVVSAEDTRDAVQAALDTFEEHLHHDADCCFGDTTYDYAKPMEPGHTVAGSDRWTEFQGEAVAAPVDSETGADWLDHAEKTAINRPLTTMVRGFMEMANVDDAPDPSALIELYASADSHGHSYSVVGDYVDENPAKARAFADSFARYHFGKAEVGDPMEMNLVDTISYQHPTARDSPHGFDLLRNSIESTDNCWVVPLDTHF